MRPPAALVAALVAAVLVAGSATMAEAGAVRTESFAVPDGAHPHDVAPDPSGGAVWYTAQHQGALGRLDPETGETRQVALGEGSRPHGVIVGPRGLAWVTDGGLNAIVSVHPESLDVTRYPLPEGRGNANLNTAAFDGNGVLWFTGQAGIYGRLDPETGEMAVFDAPRGYGPYGIDATPGGEIWYASLAGSYIGHVDTETGEVEVVDPPTADAGTRRVWSDSGGVLWVSEWNAGQLARYDPETGAWREWPLPGDDPAAYAVYVDETDSVWVSDFGANAVLRFDPETERFESFPIDRSHANVRQMLGRPGEVWAAESGIDRLTVYHYE
ncbi:lyase [Kaustia mangrovi]|uniref:Virginiamycin B lyase n=1 Tax=Kaustia mangrovi TaxID=2593653 RepID=A0A7S8C6B2_9HYPH|nr:lyase [Kaustia mangrovi]QPC44201.1 lyase [Kaustia mangrovi]